jgi:ABC-type glycerol-3-phosphate transport system substrate-binding protein
MYSDANERLSVISKAFDKVQQIYWKGGFIVNNTMIRRVISSAIAALMLTSTAMSGYADSVTEDESSSATDAASLDESAADDSTAPEDATGDTDADADSTAEGKRVEDSYRDFYTKYADEKGSADAITLTAEQIFGDNFVEKSDDAQLSLADVGGESKVLNWENQEGSFSFKVDVPTAGTYSIKMSYYMPDSSNTSDVQFELDINGESQYPTAERITLSKIWVNEETTNESGIDTDSRGNDIRPGQETLAKWQYNQPLKDIDGLYGTPLLFYFEEGENTVTIISEKADFAIKDFTLYQYEEPGDYVAPSTSDLNSTTGQTITLEGELADEKSDRTLFPTSDMHSYITSCVNGSSPTKTRYNTIGKETWTQATQSATWNVTVTQDGWYKIGIRAKQDEMRGMYSNRRLYIDGEVPCKQADQIKFYYDSNWSVTVPSVTEDDDSDPLYFYLTAGQHTITLEAVPGEIGDIMGQLDDITYSINSYYRKIRQITGPDPDEYNNYMIDQTIPEIIPDFTTYAQQLRDLKNEIETLSNQGGSEAVTLEKMALSLDKCIEKPDRIPEMMDQIKDNVTSLSSWVSTYREQPLEVDMIELCTADQEFSECSSNFFKSFKFGFDAFIGSFFEDYNSLTDIEDGEDVMTCWIALGRDNATVVTNLVNNEYNLTADTKVNMKLVQGGIIEATFAGKGPDIALFMGGDFPIQLASRGVLEDLTQFSDYEEVTKRFSSDAMTLYDYNGGVYGLPVSQTVPMLFYRSDILEELGVDAETDLTTWEGLMNVLPILQRNYMDVGLILPVMGGTSGVTTVSPVTEAGNTFAMLLLQQGVNYYNDDRTQTNFDTQEAVNAFETWTEFYTKYSFDQTYDALTRFRQGDMPVLIQNYTFYNQLSVTAPEIKGCWDFMHVPGTENENGTVTLEDGTTISIASNSSGSGALIFTSCPDKEGAWEFIKWFTSTETQVEYGNDIESVLGTMGRYDTANIEALQQLSWTTKEVNKITEQLESQVEIPVIPASYGVTRNLINAFREVANQYENARDTLFWYNKDINEEITRKNKDLGIATEDSSN